MPPPSSAGLAVGNVDSISLSDLKDYFECPVCYNVPRRPPIFQCEKGHIIIIIIILFAKLTSYIKNILDTTLSNRLTNVQRCCNSRNQTLENKLSILFLCFWPFSCHFCQLHRGSSPKFHKVSTIMHAEASTFKFHACAHFEVFLGLIRSVLYVGSVPPAGPGCVPALSAEQLTRGTGCSLLRGCWRRCLYPASITRRGATWN